MSVGVHWLVLSLHAPHHVAYQVLSLFQLCQFLLSRCGGVGGGLGSGSTRPSSLLFAARCHRRRQVAARSTGFQCWGLRPPWVHPSPQMKRVQWIAHESPSRADPHAPGFGCVVRKLPSILAVILEGVLRRLVDQEVERCAVIVIGQQDSFPVAQKCSELPMCPGGSVDDV